MGPLLQRCLQGAKGLTQLTLPPLKGPHLLRFLRFRQRTLRLIPRLLRYRMQALQELQKAHLLLVRRVSPTILLRSLRYQDLDSPPELHLVHLKGPQNFRSRCRQNLRCPLQRPFRHSPPLIPQLLRALQGRRDPMDPSLRGLARCCQRMRDLTPPILRFPLRIRNLRFRLLTRQLLLQSFRFILRPINHYPIRPFNH